MICVCICTGFIYRVSKNDRTLSEFCILTFVLLSLLLEFFLLFYQSVLLERIWQLTSLFLRLTPLVCKALVLGVTLDLSLWVIYNTRAQTCLGFNSTLLFPGLIRTYYVRLITWRLYLHQSSKNYNTYCLTIELLAFVWTFSFFRVRLRLEIFRTNIIADLPYLSLF